MYRTLVFTFACLVLGPLAPATALASLEVVTTTPDLAALAREIGGSEARVTALSLPTQDPHWTDAKPSLTLKLNRADLLVAVGLELEVGWLPTLQTGARNARVQRSGSGYLECAHHVELLDVPHGHIDRSMGDIHPGGNPHYLHDPRAAAACARAIAERMAALDARNAARYRANLQNFLTRLEARRAQWERRMRPFRGTPVITYHSSWVYLTSWLGFQEVATLEPKPGIPPSPRHVAQVIREGRARHVKLLLQESFYPSRTGQLVASRIDATLLTLPAATNVPQGQSYIEHMEELISMLERALRR